MRAGWFINDVCMIQKNREALFTLIRSYHEHAVPAKFADKNLALLAADLDRTQERVISMVLRFVQGKENFIEWTPSLEVLAGKVKTYATKPGLDTASARLLAGKVDELVALVALAKKFVVPVVTV